MTARPRHTGLTLIEILLAVTIVAILATLVITTVVRIDNRNKEELAKGLMGTLNAALSEFRDYKYAYRLDSIPDACELAFYRSLKFPPDCNDYTVSQIEIVIEDILDLSSADVVITGNNDPCDSGCEVMYFFLQRIPSSRAILSKIDESMLSDLGSDDQPMKIGVNNRENRFIHIVDPWGTTLNYDYYVNEQEDTLDYDERAETIRTFPLITSAGPDKEFGTDDDIYNRERTKETGILP